MSVAHPLGHELVGSGARRVVVLNDWFGDTSTWDAARPYLDLEQFTWAFADLRGYGRSRGKGGAFTVREAADDVAALADVLGWSELSIVGHSMSTIVALDLAQHHPARIRRLVLVTPPPPRGFGVDAAWLEQARAAVRDDVRRAELARARFSQRYSRGWAEYKTQRWLATSDASAAAEYVALYARDGIPEPTLRVAAPVLVIAGEEDDPELRSATIQQSLSECCGRLEVVGIAGCGHYPMQEAPPRTVALVESFLAR